MEERAAFVDLNLRKELLEGVAAMGFERAMPVQERVIKEGMGRDLIVQARTGSGKTVAYGCAVLETLPAGHRGPIMLVICPTRELATQVAQELEELAKAMDLSAAVLNGGASFGAQRQQRFSLNFCQKHHIPAHPPVHTGVLRKCKTASERR